MTDHITDRMDLADRKDWPDAPGFSEQVIARDRGPIGMVTLYPGWLVIDRLSEWCSIQEWFGTHTIAQQNRIPLDTITSVAVISSLLLPPLMVVRYAGAPDLTGDTLHDSMLENVHMLNPFDRRSFIRLEAELKRRLDGTPTGLPPLPRVG